MGLKQEWTEESLEATKARAQRQRHQRQLDRLTTGEYRLPRESLWSKGQEVAKMLIEEQSERVPFRVLDLRRMLDAEARFVDFRAMMMHRKRCCVWNGELGYLEQYCRKQGITIPSPGEVVQDKLEQMLEMERTSA